MSKCTVTYSCLITYISGEAEGDIRSDFLHVGEADVQVLVNLGLDKCQSIEVVFGGKGKAGLLCALGP